MIYEYWVFGIYLLVGVYFGSWFVPGCGLLWFLQELIQLGSFQNAKENFTISCLTLKR